MSFKTANVVLASAVATSGTFTVNYPEGTTAGSFAAFGHKIFAEGLQTKFEQDAGKVSMSFGASNITVTYSGTDSIPAGTNVIVQLNIAGQDNRNQLLATFDDRKRMTQSALVRVDLGAPATADSDGICESQTVTFATTPYAVLDGAQSDLSGDLKCVLDVPRNVVAAWTGTAIITITGKDEYGNVVVEKSASGTSLTGKKAFKEITTVAFSANVSAATVGFSDVIGLPLYVGKIGQIVQERQDDVVLPGIDTAIPYSIDVADMSADADYYVYLPLPGTIRNIYAIVDGAISTADITVTPLIVGGSAMTAGVVTLATAASAAGTASSATPTANNVAIAGDKLKLTVAGGGSGGSPKGHIVVDFVPTKAANGTFVAGVQTAATATTGDVRGTYDPAAACDGSKSFVLLIATSDPKYRGVDQYAG